MQTFMQAYIEAAMWSSLDDNGNPMDRIEADFSDDACAKIEADCDAFQAENESLLNAARDVGFDDTQLGHDFWLTRNNHGTGYWDRSDMPLAIGIGLTKAAHAKGEINLYVSDAGEIEIS